MVEGDFGGVFVDDGVGGASDGGGDAETLGDTTGESGFSST